MAKLTGFVFQDEYLERLKKLSDEELGRLVRALSGYHANGEIPELSGAESVAFDFIRADVDRIDHRYQAKCETNRNNRTAVHDRPRPLSSEDERDPPGTNVHKDKEKGKVKEKEKAVPAPEPKEKVARAQEEFPCGEDTFFGDVPADPLIVKVQKELNGLTDNHYGALSDYREELTDEVVSHAIDNAVGAGSRNWGYVQSILMRYAREHIRSLGEAKASDQRFRESKKPPNPPEQRSWGVKPPVNPWLDELKQEGLA